MCDIWRLFNSYESNLQSLVNFEFNYDTLVPNNFIFDYYNQQDYGNKINNNSDVLNSIDMYIKDKKWIYCIKLLNELLCINFMIKFLKITNIVNIKFIIFYIENQKKILKMQN